MTVQSLIKMPSFPIFVLLSIVSIVNANVNDGATVFAKKLCHNLPEVDKNLIVSPLAIHMLLSQLYPAAGGKTASELQSVLGVGDPNTTATEYKNLLHDLNLSDDMQTGIIIHTDMITTYEHKIRPELENIFKNFFSTNVRSNDPPLNPDETDTWVSLAGIIILNQLAVLCQWEEPFNKDFTQEEKFFISDEKSVNCLMMKDRRNILYSNNSKLDATFIKLPLIHSSDLSFVIALPNKITGIDKLKAQLASIDGPLPDEDFSLQDVNITIPKFSISSEIKLDSILKAMGLSEMLNNVTAELDIFSPSQQSYVANITQRSVLDIDERGLTSFAWGPVQMPPKPRAAELELPSLSFRADHPFIFCLIAGVNGVILFDGKLVDPTSGDTKNVT